jgi:F-type H+-transporting ATPase subunit b
VLIDWFTVIAQIINFLILLFLLRRFLYRPILDAMAAREQRVASLLEQAEQKRLEAQQERERFEAKNQELRDTYEQRRREIDESLESWRKEALQEARQEVDRTRKNWLKTIQGDQEVFLRELNQFTVRQVFQVARRAVSDLAGSDLETSMVNAFLARLRSQELDLGLLAQDGGSSESLKVRSAFQLPAELQERLRQGVRARIDAAPALEFETEPGLLGGIELVSGSGYTAAWNLRRYLETLQDELDLQMTAYLGEREAVAEQAEV